MKIDRRNRKISLIHAIGLPSSFFFLIRNYWPILVPSFMLHSHRSLIFLFLLLLFLLGIVHILLKLLFNPDYSIIRITIISINTLIILRSRRHLHIPISNHWFAQCLQQFQKIFDMSGDTLRNSLTRYMIKIVFNQFCNQINDPLYLLTSSQFQIFIYSNELNYCLRKDDFTYLKIDLLVFQDLDLINPTFNTYILEDVNSKVYNYLRV